MALTGKATNNKSNSIITEFIACTCIVWIFGEPFSETKYNIHINQQFYIPCG